MCICGRSFPNEMALEDLAREAHGSSEHGEIEAFACPECGSPFASFALLRGHWPAHGDVPDRPGHASG